MPGGQELPDAKQKVEPVVVARSLQQLLQNTGDIGGGSLAEKNVSCFDYRRQMTHSKAVHLDELDAVSADFPFSRLNFQGQTPR